MEIIMFAEKQINRYNKFEISKNSKQQTKRRKGQVKIQENYRFKPRVPRKNGENQR